ncbi:hypothetical protein OH77DRAFT_872334 [Trametes cingulata]|nr:hypothetical protein OH77DRAFT_872334 [Trametes cingulata]
MVVRAERHAYRARRGRGAGGQGRRARGRIVDGVRSRRVAPRRSILALRASTLMPTSFYYTCSRARGAADRTRESVGTLSQTSLTRGGTTVAASASRVTGHRSPKEPCKMIQHETRSCSSILAKRIITAPAEGTLNAMSPDTRLAIRSCQ